MKFLSSLIFIYSAFFLTTILQTSESFAQGERIYTLEDSIAEALANNWSLKAKEEKLNEAAFVKNQARAEFLPKLSTSYGYTLLSRKSRIFKANIPGMGDEPIEIASKNNFQWKGTVTQPVFTGFALKSSYELAKLGVDQSRMELDLERLDLIFRVKEAYYDILEADKALEVAEKAVESLESHVDVARSFYEVGMIPINDLLRSEVELGDAKQELVKAEHDARMSRSKFNTVLARPVNAPAEVDDRLVFAPERGGFQDYLQKAFANRPEMKLIEINILQSEQQIRLSKSKYYPEVALQYDYIKAGDTPGVSGSEFHESSSWEAAAVCSWTFWEWGKTHYAVKEKESIRKQLTQIKEDLENKIRLELKRALLVLEAAEKNIPTTKRAVEQGEENLRVNEERYRAQVTTSTEVLDAQRLLSQARMNYYHALYAHYMAKAGLQWAIGSY